MPYPSQAKLRAQSGVTSPTIGILQAKTYRIVMLRLPQELWLCILEHFSLGELTGVYHARDTLGQEASQVAMSTQASQILYKLFATGTPKVYFEAYGDEKCPQLDRGSWTDIIKSRLETARPNPFVVPYVQHPWSVLAANFWTPFKLEEWRIDLNDEILERKVTALSKSQVAMRISLQPDLKYSIYKQTWKECQFGASPTGIKCARVDLAIPATSTINRETQLLQLYYTSTTCSENVIRDEYPFDDVSQVRTLERDLRLSKAQFIEIDESRKEIYGTKYRKEYDLPTFWFQGLGESICLSLLFCRDVHLPGALSHSAHWAQTTVWLRKVDVHFKEILLPTNTELLKLFEANMENNEQVSQD